MNSNASSSKRKPNKKKHDNKGALLCKLTTSAKLIDDIGNDVPTLTNNILVKLSQAHKNVKETCYFCLYSLYNNCSFLQQKSRRYNYNTECLVGWLDETLQLPDIDLINNFHYELFLQYANSTSDSGFSYGNENNNSIQKDGKENEIANNLQVNKIIKENNLSEIDKIISLSNENNADDNTNIGDIQDKQCFDVQQEHDNDQNTKITLEYFGLSRIEDMFTGSDDEEAGYQSDSTIIYSPNDLTKKVIGIYVISDSESDLEVDTDICNDGKLLRKRHISESDSEGPVYKSKKPGHPQIKINIASSATSSTSASTHAANKSKARDVEKREEEDHDCDNKDTEYESYNIMGLSSNNSVKNIISFVINENDSNSKNNNDMFRKLPRETNNESDGEATMFKSAYTPIVKNVINSSSTMNSVDINTNESEIILESSIAISDNDGKLSDNTDMSTNGKLLKKLNIESVNEVQVIESANKEKTANIESFTINNTIYLPLDGNDNDVLVMETNLSGTVISDTDSDSENDKDKIESANQRINTNITGFTSNKTIHFPFDDINNDVQVIETNVPCTVISDTDSASEKNTDMNTNGKLLRERNIESVNEVQVIESANKEKTANIESFTINNTIYLPLDGNDNDVLVMETNLSGTVISDTDSDSENDNDKIESANQRINTNITGFTSNETITLPFDDNEPCTVISNTDTASEKNTDMNTNVKLLRERNNDSNNECQEIESVIKGMNTNIASFTSNETITLPFDDNDNDIQVIETNAPYIVISDTDSENNIVTNTNGKILKRNNEASPEADDGSASYKVIATHAIIESDSDLDDGWLDQYLRY